MSHHVSKPDLGSRRSGYCLAMLCLATALSAAACAPIHYAQPRKLGDLQSKSLTETSGLACGHRSADLWWTHNDSGDGPFIYALGPHGEDRGRIELADITVRDCEDMCSFVLDRTSYLLLADFGDNQRKRGSYTLYLLPEPAVPGENKSLTATEYHTLHFQYPAGQSYNCEAVAVDSTTHDIILITKRWFINDDVPTRIFKIPLPIDPAKPSDPLVVAEQIGQLDLQMVTAMDISPDGRRAIVLTMLKLYEYTRNSGETWADAFARPPRELPRPPMSQGEAVAFGPDGCSIRFTSEQRPAPFFEMVPDESDGQ